MRRVGGIGQSIRDTPVVLPREAGSAAPRDATRRSTRPNRFQSGPRRKSLQPARTTSGYFFRSASKRRLGCGGRSLRYRPPPR